MNETFEEAMSHKKGTDCTDLEWYIAMVALSHINTPGLVRKEFVYDLEMPGPEILDHFQKRTPPDVAAIEMFSPRH